jgi:hypothetical protein
MIITPVGVAVNFAYLPLYVKLAQEVKNRIVIAEIVFMVLIVC